MAKKPPSLAAKTEEEGQKEWDRMKEMRNTSPREKKQQGRVRTQHTGDTTLFYSAVHALAQHYLI